MFRNIRLNYEIRKAVLNWLLETHPERIDVKRKIAYYKYAGLI